MQSANSLFEVRDLTKQYPIHDGGIVKSLLRDTQYLRAVDEASFDIRAGEILGLAGQSGCGKSTLGELLVGLERASSGQIRFKGTDITNHTKQERKRFRQDCQVIFQDPYESLNPRFTVSRTVREPLLIHDIGTREERDELVVEALEDAGLHPPEKYLEKLPSELSGGERQRVSIARAIVVDPDFLIADEPVSMLDVSVRMGILNLFKELKEKRNLTMLYVSHDLSTIDYLADRTMIMYLGKVVEAGPTERVINQPAHPYTEQLLAAVPSPDPEDRRQGSDLRGEVPDAIDLPQGCRFNPRCPYVTDECRSDEPHREGVDTRHSTACYHPLGEQLTNSD